MKININNSRNDNQGRKNPSEEKHEFSNGCIWTIWHNNDR
jgi:hypothetical protein